MARTTPNLGLTVWNLGTDFFSPSALAADWDALDAHDHSSTKGVQIPTAGLANLAVTTAKIADLNVTAAKLASTGVTADKLADAARLGLTDSSIVRRGKSIIATTEVRANAAYGLMTTPDRVQNVVLPTDGLLYVAYSALWQESVSSSGKAAIFIGTNQLRVPQNVGVPLVQEATMGGSVNSDAVLSTSTSGLASLQPVATPSTEVTTGQVLRTGSAQIWAAAGTYDISVQFLASSGSVTVKNRKLWVWTLGF